MVKPVGDSPAQIWRRLRFESIDSCRAEIQRIVEASAADRLRTAGRWSAGQALAHVAAWIEYAYDGYPIRSAPFFVRWILRMRFRHMLTEGMPRGVRIPGVKDGTVGMEPMEVADAAARLEAALTRLESPEVPRFRHPAFGAMTNAERIQLNLRHAELHLGFIDYR